MPTGKLPDHLSFSSRDTWQSCGKRYYLSRVAKVPRPPAWWNIGGSAVHATLDSFDHNQVIKAEAGSLGPLVASWDLETAWRYAFAAEIAKAEEVEPDRSKWRIKRRSSENEAWWNAEGPRMCQRYIDWRLRSPSWRIWTAPDGGGRAIELDVSCYLPGCDREIKAFVDRVYENTVTGTLHGLDFKSGSSDGKEEQFGTYRACMERLWGVQVDQWNTFRVRDNSHLHNGRPAGIIPHERLLTHWTPRYAGALFGQVDAGIRAWSFPPRLDKHCDHFCDVRHACYAIGGAESAKWDPDDPEFRR